MRNARLCEVTCDPLLLVWKPKVGATLLSGLPVQIKREGRFANAKFGGK